jgi:hypothetical protein
MCLPPISNVPEQERLQIEKTHLKIEENDSNCSKSPQYSGVAHFDISWP